MGGLVKSGDEMVKRLMDITTCSICLESFSDPRVLPCVHTFCLKCIEHLANDKQPGDDTACPLCRNEFVIPKEGIVGLPKNFFVENLLVVSNKSNNYCDGCDQTDEKSGGRKLAVMYCADCSDRLCDDCCELHRRIKLTRNHVLLKLDDDESSLVAMSQSIRVCCDKHQDELIKLYCHDCSSTLCMMCFIEKHNSHRVADVHRVAENFRDQLNGCIAGVNVKISKNQMLVEKMKIRANQFVDKLDAIVKEISREAENLMKRIDDDRKQLIEDLQRIKEKRMSEFGGIRSEIEQSLSLSESFVNYCEALKAKASPISIAQQANSLFQRGNNLSQTDITQSAVDNCDDYDVIFTASAWPLPSSGNIVGKIHRKHTAKLIKSVHHDRQVHGVTVLNDKIYVASRNNIIEVYDSASFHVKRKLPLRGLGVVSDMTSCREYQCVYVGDSLNDNVYTITCHEEITQWPVYDQPRGLSVNSACNVLVTCWKAKRIKEFGTNGKFIREISLPGEIDNPWHAVELTADRFLLSHGDVGDPLHAVCIVNSSGQVYERYGSNPGSNSGQLNNPVRLSVNGFIFVADALNHRVVLLSPTLSFFGDIQLDNCCPSRIYYDELSNRLYVAVNESMERLKHLRSQLKVYEL